MADDKLQPILDALKPKSELDSIEYAKTSGLDHQVVVGCIKSLTSQGLVTAKLWQKPIVVVKPAGHEMLKIGTAEFQLVKLLDEPMLDTDPRITAVFPDVKLLRPAIGSAKKNKWIVLEPQKDKTMILSRAEGVPAEPEDPVTDLVRKLIAGEKLAAKVIKDLTKRGYAQKKQLKGYTVQKGPNFERGLIVYDADLTMEMLQGDAWKEANFKDYNFHALGQEGTGGHLHPLLKVRKEFREIFIEMGFEEMPTDAFVESSFWNFDALFQPQQHPARDAHDTFFLSKPARTNTIPKDYLERVKKVHSEGGYGSRGWLYDWSEEESRKNILRTHTTAVSSRMLYKLAQQEKFTPKKYFSIDRVYRNETTDATHLAEFHQVEGLVADFDIKLTDLIGLIAQFFKKIGIKDVKFKPAYNPYTEPSMEIFGEHPTRGWVEIGNSGMFRPEMLLPMGLPEGVRVIAWGLSLERPTMIKYGIGSIKDLIGHTTKLEFITKNPLCRLDKD